MDQTPSNTGNSKDSRRNAYKKRQTNTNGEDAQRQQQQYNVDMTRLEASFERQYKDQLRLFRGFKDILQTHQQQQDVIHQQQQHQKQYFETYLQNIHKKSQRMGTYSPPLPSRESPIASSSTRLNSTRTNNDNIKQPGNMSHIVRSTVIQTIQNHLISRSTMTFTSQDIENRRKKEMGYKRHQTQQPSGLGQDDYIRSTLAYVELKDMTHSLSVPIVTRHPGCTFTQLPQHVKTQLVRALNQQAATQHQLLIEKSEKNWLARYFFNSYFRSYKCEHMKRQKKRMTTTSN